MINKENKTTTFMISSFHSHCVWTGISYCSLSIMQQLHCCLLVCMLIFPSEFNVPVVIPESISFFVCKLKKNPPQKRTKQTKSSKVHYIVLFKTVEVFAVVVPIVTTRTKNVVLLL